MSQIQNAMIAASNAIRKGLVDVSTKKIYHYTSPNGLMGIFDKKTPALFFSQYDSLNDTKERKDIFEILKKYCDKQLEDGRMSQSLYNDIISIPPSDLFGITRELNEKIKLESGETVDNITSFANEDCYTYICSFSKNNDSLPMWRMYSKADHYEGFCIEFSTYPFSHKNFYGKGFNIELVEVIYNESQKLSLIESVLSPIMKLYDSATKTDKDNLLSIIKIMINRFQFAFKNKSFSYEEEIRAILHIPKETTSCTERFSERKYRHNNGLIVPYIIYNLENTSALSITLAPTIKEEISVINLKDYLLSKELDHIDILLSDIPIRRV